MSCAGPLDNTGVSGPCRPTRHSEYTEIEKIFKVTTLRRLPHQNRRH